MKLPRVLLGIGILVLAAAASGCGACGGTETGNCGSAHVASGSGSYGFPTSADTILYYTCTKLSDCHAGLAYEDCTIGVLGTTNIDVEIGMTGGAYPTYQDLIDDETAGKITADTTALNTCLNDIDTLNCTDGAVTGAWNSGSPSDFSNVETMFPAGAGSCPDVY